MSPEEIDEAVRFLHEQAKRLTQCGQANVERRATEILAMSYCLVWSELPLEALDLLVEGEKPNPVTGRATSP